MLIVVECVECKYFSKEHLNVVGSVYAVEAVGPECALLMALHLVVEFVFLDYHFEIGEVADLRLEGDHELLEGCFAFEFLLVLVVPRSETGGLWFEIIEVIFI